MARIPERCPWCGATENIRADGVLTGAYACGSAITGQRTVKAACIDGRLLRAFPWGLPSADAWRRRLSQHTGVPLREIPMPTVANEYHAWWDTGEGQVFVGHTLSVDAVEIPPDKFGNRVLWGLHLRRKRSEIRTEAARRIREMREGRDE